MIDVVCYLESLSLENCPMIGNLIVGYLMELVRKQENL
jgi:hypothetical protein